ncbi:uncharacterized protein METZ01_LOCUS34478 [marine metagenome]|uniref:Uncharacterized protein n=1 Tax=marine metagenome TaxID=408172 RepID=A0A381QRN0_9ZZZZ
MVQLEPMVVPSQMVLLLPMDVPSPIFTPSSITL